MNRKKVIKFLIVILYIIAIVLSVATIVHANAPIVNLSSKTDSAILGKGKKIIGVMTYICYGFAVGIIAYSGVQFMIAAPEGKADVKKKSIYLAVGGVILFSVTSIVKIVLEVTNNNIVGA